MDRDQAQQKLNAIEKVAINHAVWCFGITSVIGIVILFFMGSLFDAASIRSAGVFVIFMTIGTYINATRSQTFEVLIENES